MAQKGLEPGTHKNKLKERGMTQIQVTVHPHHTVADYRPITVQLQLKTLLPCIAFHLTFRFSFWLTKLPKMKIGCVIFCMMFSVCKARQARQK